MSGHRRKLVVGLQCRVSSIKQVTRGHSLDGQRQDVIHKANLLFGEGGYESRFYPDEGVSGTLGTDDIAWLTEKTRPGLSQLLYDAERGELDAVIFPSVDRLSRRELVFWNVVEKLQKHQVPFYFADLDLDPNSETGRMLLNVLQGMASDFSHRHRRRQSKAMAQRRADGYQAGGIPPYGWRWEEPEEMTSRRRGWAQDEAKAPWVRWMRDKYLDCGWTTTQIAEELRRQGVPRRRGGTYWDSSQVRNVLLTPAHAGLIVEKDGSTRPGAHWERRLWDPEDRERMVARLTRNRKLGASTVAATEWLLLGVIRCGHCGLRLVAGYANKQRRYTCQRTRHADGSRCDGVTKVADVVEAMVMEQVLALGSSEEMQALSLREAEALLCGQDDSLGNHIAELELSLADIDKRVAGIVDMRARSEITSEEFQVQHQRLDGERETAEGQLAAARAELKNKNARQIELQGVQQALRDCGKVWEHLVQTERRELLATLIERVSLSRTDDGTGDVILRLKVRLLPEQEFRIPHYTKRPQGTGVAALSPRELAVLKHILDGRENREIAELFETTVENVSGTQASIRRRVGNEDLFEVAELARSRIELLGDALPLSGRMNAPSNRDRWSWTAHRLRILRMLSDGVPRRLIAAELGIERKTVDNHICMVMRQVGAANWKELLAKAAEVGILPETCVQPVTDDTRDRPTAL